MMIHRRGLLLGLGSLLAAPAIVRASSLMPVKAVKGISDAELIYKWKRLICSVQMPEKLYFSVDQELWEYLKKSSFSGAELGA